jgi:hypothetical protein
MRDHTTSSAQPAGQPPPPPTTRKKKKKKMRRITVCVLADGCCCCCYNCAGSGTCANYLAVEIVSFCVEGVVAMVITTAGDMFRPLSFFFSSFLLLLSQHKKKVRSKWGSDSFRS